MDGPTKTARGAEVDKLKRRMIRTVSRLLKEKKTEQEVWEVLKKEGGTNCKLLWERMRSLTVKKLKRLLDADDCVDNIPSVARMSLTDWLLFDLIIVHEKIDVIDRHNQHKTSKMLENLFSLVKQFDVEGRSGAALADAWTSATIYYNSTGHQCSPMLMQRRWYQVKELTRHKFYKFWFSYRGNERLLVTAKEDAPSDLQKAIAIKYPGLITKAFPSWEERIENKEVIMPEEFEVKLRNMRNIKPSDEKSPDIVLVEPRVEVIELEMDSDPETPQEEIKQERADEAQEMQTPIIVQVKTEPQEFEDTADNYNPEGPKRDKFDEEIERLKMEEDAILIDEDSQDSEDIITEENENEAQETQNESEERVMPLTTDVTGPVATGTEEVTTEKYVEIPEASESEPVEENTDTNVQSSTVLDVDAEVTPTENFAQTEHEVESSNAILRSESEVYNISSDEAAPSSDREEHHIIDAAADTIMSAHADDELMVVTSSVTLANDADFSAIKSKRSENSQVLPKGNIIQDVQDVVHEIDDDDDSPVEEDIVKVEPENEGYDFDEVPTDINFADDGIEFVDDGIEYVEEDQGNGDDIVANNEDEAPKFDLKLLMTPVIYTTKLDNMTVYKDKMIETPICGQEILDKIIIESKPISNKSINNVDQVQDEKEKSNIVEQIDAENVGNLIDDDLFQNDSSDESECDVIDESKKVRLSSNLLQKPKNRSYNPIQLCKNPDFNTRLKRINVGFFSYPRNRIQLKACKPLTIDLSKAFESRLVDGTMYLKPSDPVIRIDDEEASESAFSIVPSTMPVQSLMDSSDIDTILSEELKKRMLERNRIINLPDISEVRRINQHLLTAEVTPIRVQDDVSKPTTKVENTPRNIIGNIRKDVDICFNNDVNNIKQEPDVNITGHSNSSTPDVTIVEKKGAADATSNGSVDRETLNAISNRNAAKKPRTTILLEPSAFHMSHIDKRSKEYREHEKSKKEKIFLPMWTKCQYNVANSDALLTIDTLYKMLNALNPCVEYASKLNKPKHKKKQKEAQSDECIETEKNEENKKSVDPPIDSVNQQPSKTAETQDCNKPAPVPKIRVVRQKYCCWAKQKIHQIEGKKKRCVRHTCHPSNCTCCCREELKRIRDNNSNEVVTESVSDSIESVVQKTRELAVATASISVQTPTKTISDLKLTVSAEGGHLQMNTSNNSDTVFIVNDTNETETRENDNGVKFQSTLSPNPPPLRVYAGSHVSDEPKIMVINPNPHLSKIEPKFSKFQLPSKYTLLPEEPEEDFPCTCRQPNLSLRGHGIIIDGLNNCLRHKKARGPKETKIYLNRKRMGITERPFFVGKNKILLTNVILRPPEREPPLSGMINVLPDGVQVIMLPDGTLNFIIDPKVKLTSEQMSTLSHLQSIKLALQEQIAAAGFPVPLEPVVNVSAQQVADPISLDNDSNTWKLNERSPDKNNSREENVNTVPAGTTQVSDDTLVTDVSTTVSSNSQDEISKPLNDVVGDVDVNIMAENNAIDTLVPDKITTESSENKNVKTTTQDDINRVLESSEANEVTTKSENTSVNVETVTQDDVNKDSETSKANEVATNNESESNETITLNTNNRVSETLKENEVATNPERANASVETVTQDDVNKVLNTSKENEDAEKTEIASGSIEKITQDDVDRASETNKVVKNAENANATANRKTLLSDLMEMSGIMEEDIAPAQEAVVQEPVLPTVVPVIAEPMQATLQVDIQQPLVQVELDVPALSPIPKKNTISAQIDDKRYELSPITSFAELKYACDNNGLFFKLDLNSGVIVPINVCIQKTGPKNTILSPNSKTVIDLTDEADVSENDEIQPTEKSNKHEIKSNTTMADSSPTSLNSPVLWPLMNTKTKPHLTSLLNNLKELKSLSAKGRHSANILKGNRILRGDRGKEDRRSLLKGQKSGSASKLHQRLKNRIEARIDLVDSDAPMEEEYLMSSDSSDDEPLAKKAKRIRPEEADKVPIAEPENEESAEEVDFEDAIDAISSVVNSEIEPIPTQLVLTGDALNTPLPMETSFMEQAEYGDDSQDDDCILGV